MNWRRHAILVGKQMNDETGMLSDEGTRNSLIGRGNNAGECERKGWRVAKLAEEEVFESADGVYINIDGIG